MASNVPNGDCQRLLNIKEESDELTNCMTDCYRDSKGLLVSLTADSAWSGWKRCDMLKYL